MYLILSTLRRLRLLFLLAGLAGTATSAADLYVKVPALLLLAGLVVAWYFRPAALVVLRPLARAWERRRDR